MEANTTTKLKDNMTKSELNSSSSKGLKFYGFGTANY